MSFSSFSPLLLQWQNAVDFLVLAMVVYAVLQWAKEARALRIALAIVALHVGAMLATHFRLVIVSWILDGLALVVVVLLVVVFQPELRRALMRLDNRLRLGARPASALTTVYQALSQAVFALAAGRTGALIVIPMRDTIGELIDGGIPLDAEISRELVETVFQKSSPLHDGAVIVKAGRLDAAGVVLPLTQRTHVPAEYGMRHRAAMGIAERSDAVVLVVSEERGDVRFMRGRQDRLILDRDELAALLRNLQPARQRSRLARLRVVLTANLRVKAAAAGLASVIWFTSFVAAGTAIRTVSVPIQFSNVPVGEQITEQTPDSLEVQVRGSPLLIDAVNLSDVVAQFNLSNVRQGINRIRVEPGDVSLPPGVVVDRVWPATITIRLVRRAQGQPDGF